MRGKTVKEKTDDKKILMVCFAFHPQFSGAVYQAQRLSISLQKLGIKCEFLVPNNINNLPFKKTIDENNIRIFHIWRITWLFPVLFFWFLLLNHKKYNAVHFHGISASHFLCVLSCRFFKMKIIQKLTQGNAFKNELNIGGFLGPLRKRSVREITHFIAISSSLKHGLEKAEIHKDKIHLIPNGVDVNFYCPENDKREGHHREYISDQKDIILLNVGAVQPRKNQLLLLDILESLIKIDKSMLINFKLIFAGPFLDKEYHSKILETARDKNISHLIQLKGMVKPEALKELYNISDIMVFTGINEGLPNVLLEAKSSGLPIIAFSAPGVDDVIRSGEDGFLIEYGNIKEFAEKICQLSYDHVLLNLYARNGRTDAVSRFTFSSIAARYIDEVYFS